MQQQFYVLTLDPRAAEVFKFLTEHHCPMEVHLNRTKFEISNGPLLTEFLLRFSECCPQVENPEPLKRNY